MDDTTQQPGAGSEGFTLPCEIRFKPDGTIEAVTCDLIMLQAALKAGVPLAPPYVPEGVAEAAGFKVEGPFTPTAVEEWRIEPSNGGESG
jgi:hypothetical protein